MNITTHNGTITVKNAQTGGHRTFRIRTQPKDAKFAPGERVIGLLTGSDNTSDYTNFGFVKNGTIHLWQKKATGDFIKFKDILENPSRWGMMTFLWSSRCIRCNKKLTTPESIESGIGPYCAKQAA